MKTLVTGATGLIGNAVARALVARGDDVRALVRDADRARSIVPGPTEIVRGDLTDPSTFAEALEGIEIVFHIGGLPEQWFRDESIFDRVNRQGTADLLAASQMAGVRRVVHTSTMDVFRLSADGKLHESNVDPDPKPSAYERSKQAAEREVDAARAKGLDVVVVNPAGVYGPAPVVTGFNQLFVRLLTGKVPMLPPGGASVSYIDGIVQGHLAAADLGEDGERYLLADAHVSIAELGATILRAAGRERIPRTAPAWLLRAVAGVSAPLARTFGFRPMIAPGELGYLLWNAPVDASKARERLGFRPFTIEEGVRRTVEHLRTTGLAPRG